MQQYDSALYYAKGNHDAAGLLIKAQAYSYLSIKDSAVYYAKLVLSITHELHNQNNALYILTNDDESKDKAAIRQTAADRADIPKSIEIRQAQLAQAVQLLEQGSFTTLNDTGTGAEQNMSDAGCQIF